MYLESQRSFRLFGKGNYFRCFFGIDVEQVVVIFAGHGCWEFLWILNGQLWLV
jgi:hypothetical protein